MWINQITVHDYRAFQKQFNMKLSKNITVIAGLNGVGKSTLLAILTNVGELKKYKALNGKPFRGEFSDVIMYDKENDTVGDKATIYFSNLPSNPNEFNVAKKLSFRASTHSRTVKHFNYIKIKGKEIYNKQELKQKITRYRLIPKKSPERNNERKVIWPSFYMGLSRLTPIGEKDSVIPKKIPIDISKKIINDHKEILSEKEDLKDASIANFDIGANFPKANITAKDYGFASNSNGQDNTGQIIEAVYSFANLKKELEDNGKEYIGGILAIDELDATLHPAAQNKIFDWLLKKSKELDLQIVFTTHSITLLEYASKLQGNSVNKENIKINYLHSFADDPGKVIVKENPNPNYYKYDLQQTYSNIPDQLPEVFVLSEDEITRWFAKKLIKYSNKEELLKLEWLDVNISWSHLLNLYNANPNNFSNYIFILDPDLNFNKEHTSQLKEYMKDHFVSFQVNDSNSNIFILPGSKSIENIMWEYIHNITSTSPTFDDPLLIQAGINYDSLRLIDKDEKFTDDNNHKKWFKDNRTLMDVMVKYWIRDNESEVKKFIGIMLSSYKRIASNK